jgi:hypothetical protein
MVRVGTKEDWEVGREEGWGRFFYYNYKISKMGL